MTTAEAKSLLKSLLPPGFAEWFDFSAGSFGDLTLAAAAEQFAQRVGTNAELIEQNANPQTVQVDYGLAAWEVALGLAGGRTATFGTRAARKAAIVAKLREYGASTLAAIRAVVGPLLGYADPTQLTILETDRATLTAAHTYENAVPMAIVGGGDEGRVVTVADGGAVSSAGAVVILDNPSFSDPSDVEVILTDPSGNVHIWESAHFFNQGADPLYLHAKTFTPSPSGNPVGGDWTVEAVSVAGDISWDDCKIFVEGITRYSGTAEGLGAEIFRWAVLAFPSLEGTASPSDRVAARAAIQRIKPAHTAGFLAVSTSVPGGYAVWGDDSSAFDGCIWG